MREIEHLKRNCKKDTLLDYHTESLRDFGWLYYKYCPCQFGDVREKKETMINSICQDLLYFFFNGTIRTKKHAFLGLCLKRITGSKECLQWLNRSGHCISYGKIGKLFMFFYDTLFG